MEDIKVYDLRSNDYFALMDGPYDKKQHPNQQCGLDLYVTVLNIGTGEVCVKKLYENGKGLHFKHTGYPPSYLDDMDMMVSYTPYQCNFIN